jgi:monoamine oxidase
MAGDQLSYWTGWQEGAVLAAWEAIRSIDQHNRATSTRRL